MPPPCFLSHPPPLCVTFPPSCLHHHRLCGDTPNPISCISCQAKIHHWQKGCWKSEISHRLNILTWNLCWWWDPLPSSDPSVTSSPECVVVQHGQDYELAEVYLLSLSHVLFLFHCVPSKDFYRQVLPPFVCVIHQLYCHNRIEN